MEDKPVYPSDVADKVLVRMPDGMRDQLKALAKHNNRTLNAEIVARLSSSFLTPVSEDVANKMLRAEVDRLTAELKQLRSTDGSFLGEISDTVEGHIRLVMKKTGLTFEEALLLTTTRGASLALDAPIVVVQVAKDTPLADARELMRVFNEYLPNEAHVYYEPTEVAKTRLLSNKADLKKARNLKTPPNE